MELTLSGNRAAIFAHLRENVHTILLLRAPDGVTIGKLFVVIVAPLPRARVVANLAGNLEFIDNQPGLN